MADSRPVVIAHISDLHCGSSYYIPSLATRVVDEINETAPDVVVVTGDLTDMGFRQRVQDRAQPDRPASRASARSCCPATTTHATSATSTSRSCSAHAAASWRSRACGILGLDSSEPDLDDGRVGRERYRWIEERFSDPEEFKIVAHAPPPRPGARHRPRAQHRLRRRRLPAGAGHHAACDLVLCGHKHVPNVWRLEDMLIVNAGTACSTRVRGRVKPCYNVIEI